MELLAALFPNILASIVFALPGCVHKIIQNNKSIEKKLNDAFEKAIYRFYASPYTVGNESRRKYKEYLETLKSEFSSPAYITQAKLYPKLLSLFEEEVRKDKILLIWFLWHNMKYTKEKLDLISEQNNTILSEVVGTRESVESFSGKMDQIMETISINTPDISMANSLLPLIKEKIFALKFKEAHESLSAIRQELMKCRVVDYSTLSKVEYLRGTCSRFSNWDRAIQEYDAAYNAMMKIGRYDEDIISGKIISALMSQNLTVATELSEELEQRFPGNVWYHAVQILCAEKPLSVINKLSGEQRDNVIANLLLTRTKIALEDIYNLNDYKYTIPQNLSLDNLPLWILYINLSLAKFFQNDRYNLFVIQQASSNVRELYEITGRYLELQKNIEIEGLLPDVAYINAYMGFVMDKDAKWLDVFVGSDCNIINKGNYTLFHISILITLQLYNDALQVIDAYKDEERSNIFDVIRCTIANVTADSQPAERAYNEFCSSKRLISDNEIYHILLSLLTWPDVLGAYVENLCFENPETKELFLNINNGLSGNDFSKEWLSSHQQEYDLKVISLIGVFYKIIGDIEEGIKLVKPLISPKDVENSCNWAYQDLLSADSKYASDEYAFLRELHAEGNIDVRGLMREYNLAFQCSDFATAISASEDLMKLVPDNNRAYACYIIALSAAGNSDTIKQQLHTIRSYDFALVDVQSIVNVLLREKLWKEAIELLYHYIITTDDNGLKDFYITISTNPQVHSIISMDEQIIEAGHYVYFHEEGDEETKKEVIDSSSKYKELIGCHTNQTVSIKIDGEIKTLVIDSIHNKYYKLQVDVYSELFMKGDDGRGIKVLRSDDLFNGDDIITNLKRLAGITPEMEEIQQKNIEKYKNRQTTMFALMRDSDMAAECTRRLFGSELVWSVPYQANRAKLNNLGIDVTQYEMVLDITSLLVLYEIVRRFGIDFTVKLIVPKGLRDALCDYKVREECNLPSIFDEQIKEKLQMFYGRVPFATRLDEIVKWVDENCVVEVVTQALQIPQGGPESTYFNIEAESLFLIIDRPRLLITEDWALDVMLKCPMIINSESLVWLLDVPKRQEITKFLADCHFINCNIDSDYIEEQYFLKRDFKPNNYDEVLLTIKNNISIYGAVSTAAFNILKKEFLSPASILAVENMMVNLFSNASYGICVMIIKHVALIHGRESTLVKCMLNALTICHPISQ